MGLGVIWGNSLWRAGRNQLVRAQEPADIADAVAFAKERLGFHPDETQERVAAGRAARDRELHAAVGQIDRDGPEGGASRVFPAGQPNPRAGAEQASEREFLRKAED